MTTMSDPLLNANLLYHLREKNYFSVLQLLRGKEDLLDDSFNRLLLGIALLMTDNADEATAEFEKIPGYSNVHLGAKMGLIQALRTRDKLDEQRMAALQASLDAIKAKPSQMELYSFATVLFFTGQYEEADKALNQLLTNFPHAPEALILKGWLELAQSSNTKKALQYVEQGASMNNFRSDPNVLLARAKCAELSGKVDDALEQLGKICITSESFLPAMVERAKLFLGKRNWEAFAAEAQSCKEMSVNDYCSLNLWILAQITYYGSYAEASKCMTQLSNGAVQVGLRSAGFMCDVILVYIRSSGRDPHVLEGARRLVEGIQKKDGNNGDVKCLLGELYRMKRSYTNSLKEYQAASLLQKSSLPSLSGIAHCFITQRQMNDGEAQMELITAVDSGWQQSAEGSFLLCLMSIQRSKDLTSLDAALDDLNAKFQKHIENINSSYSNGIQFLRELNADRFLEMLQIVLNRLSSMTRDLQKQLSDHICSTALSILASLLEYIPGLLAVFFLKACFHILRDDVDKATEELRECLAKDAENSSVYLLLAEISLRQGNYNEAKSTLEAAVSYDFNVRHQPNYHLIRARLAAALNDTKEAIAILNNAVKLHCLNSPKAGAAEQSFFEYESLESIKFKIRLELAKLLQLNGDLAEAEELLTDLSQQHDEDQEGQIILSQCDLLLRRNDVNKALNLLSEISSDKWYYVQARKVMADIYLTYRKDKRQYIACFKEMMHSSPTPEIFIAAGEAYARILEMEKAIEMYETALRKNPKDFALTRTIGQTYVRSHNYLKAVSYFEAALKKSGHDLIRYDLALLLLKLGKTDKCERYLRQYFDAFKSQDEKKSSDLKLAAKFYELYSRLYLEMNQHELSIETLQKAKNLYLELAKSERSVRGEDNVEHLLQACRLSQSIGNFYEGQHAYSKAAVYYTEGLKYDAKNIKLMLNLAHIYLITNNLEECHQQCRAVMKIDKNNDEATLLLADLMYQKNEMSTALDLFKSLLERNPNQYHALLRVMEFSLRMGTTDDVESLFTSALTRNRRAMTDSGFNYCKGFYEWKTGNSSGALSFFSKARKDAQWGEQATYNMIEILLNPDNKVIGSDAWEKDQLQEADNDRLENHSTGNVHLKMAEMYLKELRFKQKNDFKYKLMENLLLLASKDKTAPEKVLNNLLRMGGDDASQDESNVGVILGLARVYRILKQNAKAKVCLKKTLNAPWNFENANWLEQCWLLLADIYIGQSKNEHALEVLKTCVKYNASCIKAMDYMGTISQKLQLWKNATTDYEKAWKLSRQRDADIGYKLAYCYLKAKMYVAAIDTCHAVLRLCPDYPKVRQEILEKARINLRV